MRWDPSKQATIAGWIPDMPWIGQCPRFLVPERHNFGPFIRRHGFGLA